MNINFWKLSQGYGGEFGYSDMISSLNSELVYVYQDTKPKGQSETSQGEDFINAPTGDYFYLTHGNQGMFCIGQFTGPANIFSKYQGGWVERSFKFIFPSIKNMIYSGPQKWWTPNDNSTFIKVPKNEYAIFEKEILIPFFDVHLSNFGV